MKNKFDSPIDELKYYLTLQLEAHLRGDTKAYEDLEQIVLRVEKKL